MEYNEIREDIGNTEIMTHRTNKEYNEIREDIGNTENMEHKDNIEHRDNMERREIMEHSKNTEFRETRENTKHDDRMEHIENNDVMKHRENNGRTEHSDDDVVNVESDEEPEFWSEQEPTGDKRTENLGKEPSEGENTGNSKSALDSKRSNRVDILIDKLNNILTRSSESLKARIFVVIGQIVFLVFKG